MNTFILSAVTDISDIPYWFSMQSVFSYVGMAYFLFNFILIYKFKNTYIPMSLILIGILVLGVCVNYSDSYSTNFSGFSRMMVCTVNGDENLRLEQEVLLAEREAEYDNKSFRYRREYENSDLGIRTKKIFAMHCPYSFKYHPNPEIKGIIRIPYRIFHPACLFWSPFFACLIFAPSVIFYLTMVIFGSNIVMDKFSNKK